MNTIKSSLDKIRAEISSEVTLVAVSKTYPNEAIIEAYNHCQRVFGENRVQEIIQKYNDLPKDIQWHMIGVLQTNKVKYIAPFITLIHSVDSEKLLAVIDKEAKKLNRVIDILMEVHIAEESSKHGWDSNELLDFISKGDFNKYENVSIKGIMGMATFTDEADVVEREFSKLKEISDSIKHYIPLANTISMGMSEDYKLAIKHGSTMIRIGSSIFGKRDYKNK